MGFCDILSKLLPAVRATKWHGLDDLLTDPRSSESEPGYTPLPPPDMGAGDAFPVPEDEIDLGPAGPGKPVELPQRTGTFLLVDLYPGDLKGKPNWVELELNSRIGNCEVVGAILKATEGISYKYTDWFVQNGRYLRNMWSERLGRERFMGAYHFLQLRRDGRAQAEYFVRTMEKIDMPKVGLDIHPALDFEQGGQVGFFPTDTPKDKGGRYELHRLPDAVKRDLVKRAMEVVTSCADRIKELTGVRPMLYGRGLQRDLGMTLARGYTREQLRMGCVTSWNPAYTKEIVSMEPYGWPIEDVALWQYGGDGVAAHPKLPKGVPNFGLVDMNVHIDGPRKTTLDSFRKALVCK